MNIDNEEEALSFIQAMDTYGDLECANVHELHEKFDFPRSLEPRHLEHEDMMGRFRFMLEELHEFKDALDAGDLPEMFDALLDLVYVAKGTAVQLGLPWSQGWDSIHRANMDKERSEHKTDRGYDLIKPEGWVAPDHTELLVQYGWKR